VGTYQPLRFLATLGVPAVENVTSEHLLGLVTSGADETAELEFKAWPHEAGPKGAYEIGKDVAAMANASGGVIIIGITESADKHAETLIELDIDGKFESRVYQVMAERVFPMPEVAVYAVPAGATKGQYLVVVPPSPLAPHAVRGDRDGTRREPLTYWVRNGNQSTALAESQVADRYRNRFVLAASTVPRGQALVDEAATHLSAGNVGLWLLITLVPTRLGALTRGEADLDSFKKWIGLVQSQGLPDFTLLASQGATVTKGVRRRVTTAVNPYRGTAEHNYIELHDDGAGIIAVQQVQYEGNKKSAHVSDYSPDLDHVIREEVAVQTLAALSVLSQHAARTGAGGDAVVTARLLERNAKASGVILLARYGSGSGLAAADANPQVLQTLSTSEHTLALDSILTNPRDLVIAAHAVAGDIFADFGHEGLFGFDDKGTVAAAALVQPNTQRGQQLAAWASANGLVPGQ
jgi:hypothetical protein